MGPMPKCPGTQERPEVCCPLGTKWHHAGGTEDAEQVTASPALCQGAWGAPKGPTESITMGEAGLF